MFRLIPSRLRAFLLRRHLRAASWKVRLIEGLDLPDDLKQAASRRVLRRFEERLERFTRAD